MVHNYKDVLLDIVAKNAQGKTFHNITSLKFDFQVKICTIASL